MKSRFFCLLQIAVLMFSSVFILGCALSAPPAISVSAESVIIDAVTNKATWDEENDPEQEIFGTILETYSPDKLPFVAAEEEITIQFSLGLPDSMLLSEYLIYIEGDGIMASEITKEMEFRYKRKKAFFTIEPIEEMPAYTEVLRGYKIVCRFSGGHECEYTFIIRSAKIYNIPELEPATDPAYPNITFVKYAQNHVKSGDTFVFNSYTDLTSFKNNLTLSDDSLGYAHLLNFLSLYSGKFFETNTLIFAVTQEETRSTAYKIENTLVENARLTLTLKRLTPLNIDEAPCIWITFAVIPKSEALISTARLIINDPIPPVTESNKEI